MGLFDALNALRDAKVAKHKADIAESNMKIKNVEMLGSLADILAEKMKPGPDTMTVGGQGAPDISATETGQVNPSLVPTITPGKPAMTTGNQLLDMLVPSLVRTGGVKEAAAVAETMADPKRVMFNNMFGGGSSVAPGTSGPVNMQPGGGMAQFQDIIDKGAAGDRDALGAAAVLKAAGIDLSPFIERKQRALETDDVQEYDPATGETKGVRVRKMTGEKVPGTERPTKGAEKVARSIYDPSTGIAYEAMFNKATNQEIPGTRVQVKPEEITWKKEAQPGGAEIEVPYRGRERLSIIPAGPQKPSLTLGQPAPGSNLPAFDIPLSAGASPDAAASQITGGTGGIVTKQPPGADPIKITDVKSWINPDTKQHPSKVMTEAELQAGGFVPYEKLSATDEAVFPLAVNSLGELTTVKQWLFPNGKLDMKRWSALQAGVGEGGRMKGKVVQALWAQLRKETGAAVTKEEAEAKFKEYLLGFRGVLDPEGIKNGIDRLHGNLTGFITQADPTGVHRKLLPKVEQPKTPVRTGTYQGRKVVEYSDGSVEYAP